MRAYPLLMVVVLGVIYAQTSQAEPIGRLFSTPAERSTLDYLRQTKKTNLTQTETPVQETAPEMRALPNAINMQGYVKRSDGKLGTVWVNGEAMQENSGNQDVQIGKLPGNSNRVPIKLPANGKYLTLKAGQIYDPESNRVREAKSHSAQGDSGTIGQQEF